ncbi:hypothetical protein ACVRXQ_11170 [Streptococcus panodentis]|uniref:Uncharacterized protein n=1 Tax=Streptococcus panodentis TaxID=1581472 RepID=A0ABS5AYH7_9STRE|nr:hypothetical protein [Streptococcus panodentis]MBP2621637.1 hypothetical protein [Streptococcus panodentis]
MIDNKDLPIQEYLAVKKEAYYSMILLLVNAVITVGLSFVLLYSGSRQRIFESIMFGSLFLISAFIVRPYWMKKKSFEAQYPELAGISIKGASVPSSYLLKRILVFSGEFILLLVTFNAQYHPVKHQENPNPPVISNNSADSSSSSSSVDSSSEVQSSEEGSKRVVHVPTLGDIEVDLGSIESSSSSEENESEVSANE